MSPLAPDFPYAGKLIAPLRAASEAAGITDCMQMWSGQAPYLAREMPSGDLTRKLAAEVLAIL